MKVVIITQARMASTRLPGKVLKEVLGKPLLQYHIERLRQVRGISDVVVATTVNESDDLVENVCKHLSYAVFRGSERDVLGRYYRAAKVYHADAVIRVTSDCPLIDPFVIEQVVQSYLHSTAEYDYFSNTIKRTFPRGMDTEVFSAQVLEEAFQEARLDYEREHVTPFFYMHPERYRIGNLTYHTDVSQHRWTVDTPEDFELIRRIITAFAGVQPAVTLEDILRLLKQHPQWTLINAHIEQKNLDQ